MIRQAIEVFRVVITSSALVNITECIFTEYSSIEIRVVNYNILAEYSFL